MKLPTTECKIGLANFVAKVPTIAILSICRKATAMKLSSNFFSVPKIIIYCEEKQMQLYIKLT